MNINKLLPSCAFCCAIAACGSVDTSPYRRTPRDAVAGSRAPSGPSTQAAVPRIDDGAAAVRAVPSAGTPTQPSPSPLPRSSTPATPKTFVSIDETLHNKLGLPADQVERLMAGGPRGSLRLLYPYDGTVFPQGMWAPTIMWQGGSATDVVYLHIKSLKFEYRGILQPGLDEGIHNIQGVTDILEAIVGDKTERSLQIPQEIWEMAGAQSEGRGDTFTVELNARVNGSVAGPVTTHLTIAQANLRGAIYYNTYDEWGIDWNDPTHTAVDLASGGKVMRIPLGGRAEVFTKTSDGCYGCHSVAANGSRVIVQLAGKDMLIGLFPMSFSGTAISFQLDASGPMNARSTKVGPRGGFAAVYPDGSKYLATSRVIDVGGMGIYENLGTPTDAVLYDANSGQVIPDTGIPSGALMPSFSPDGTRLVFNDFALDKATGLATMNYDTARDRATEYSPLIPGSSGDTTRPAFPAFLPDNAAVIYSRTASPTFTPSLVEAALSTGTGQIAATGTASSATQNSHVMFPTSDLYIVDVESKQETVLANAMGFESPAAFKDASKTYLPFGAEDLHANYQPTVLPVALGGYYWVFFDSRRHFGNLGLQRQLWVAAIDVHTDGHYTLDPSHPPFYVPGQGFGANNHRAFAALAACKNDAEPCTSGIDCCAGACGDGVCAPPPPGMCAHREERCTTQGDCCSDADACIAGFCSVVDLL